MVESVDLSLLELGGNGFKRKGSRSKAKDKKEKADDMGEDDATNEAAETSNGDDQDDAARELRQQAFMESHVSGKIIKHCPFLMANNHVSELPVGICFSIFVSFCVGADWPLVEYMKMKRWSPDPRITSDCCRGL